MIGNKLLSVFKEVSLSRFILIITVLNLVLYHGPLYRYAINNMDIASLSGVQTFATLLVVVFMISVILFSIIGIVASFLLKPLYMLLAVLSSLALYFMSTYNVIYDRDMMGNIFNTRLEESSDFINPYMFLSVFIFGLLPAFVVSKIRITTVKRIRVLVQAVVVVVLSLVFVVVNSTTWLWFDEHSKQLGGSILPWSFLVNTARSQAEKNKGNKVVVMLPDAQPINDEKMLVVLVIGETARSDNFSLYGYDRNTNPKLAKRGVAALAGAKSCSTYTTASLRCMLSHDGKPSGSFEVLPSYLQRHGVDVLWRTNNWGEPPIKVSKYENAGDLKKVCVGEFCESDDVLLTDLEESISAFDSNKTLVTLHVKGSHGPAYHARYPKQFDVFKPVCRSVELAKCNEQSLINAYDNTILYTDSFLDRAIEILRTSVDVPVVLLYVSDHGESLGEYGLYLHGTPYAFAPDFQKNIPFIIWMSDAFKDKTGVNPADLSLSTETHSHSHVFHTIMGAFGVKSEVYNASLDLFNK